MKKNRRMQVLKVISSAIVVIALLPACHPGANQEGDAGSVVAPAEGWSLSFSFPNGAPALGLEAELLCTVETRVSINAVNLRVWVVLPPALQFVSGNLTWESIVTAKAGQSLRTVNAVVRSVEVGDSELRVHAWLPDSTTRTNFRPEGYAVFLSIREDSAAWSLHRPNGGQLPTGEVFPSGYPTPPSTVP